MSQVIGLFPTPLLRVERLLPPALVDALVEQFSGDASRKNAQSVQLAHTEILSPAESPHLQQAAQLIGPHLVAFGELLFGEPLPWAIKEVWVNVLQTGGHQAVHNHANSFASGVIYLTPSHASASTVFVKALGGSSFVFNNAHGQTSQGPFCAERWIMPKVNPGDLVLFPSYLLHEVPRNEGETRITLAFNALPQRLNSWGYSVGFTR